jgi:hypothetical protein
MKELTSYDIENLCKQLNIRINAILCRDEVNKIITPGWYIFNMDKSTGSGTHWVACYFGKNANLYFDSFGMIPFQELDDKLEPYMYNH